MGTEAPWLRLLNPLPSLFFTPRSLRRPPCRGQSLLERGVDEKGDSGALSTCLRVMSRMQQLFYEQGAPLLLGQAR